MTFTSLLRTGVFDIEESVTLVEQERLAPLTTSGFLSKASDFFSNASRSSHPA
jgi:hypothetical protein